MSGITRSTDHHYTYDGKTYPGVTGMLNILDKSGPLMGWAARQTAEAAIAQIDNLPSLLESVGGEGVIKALTARSGWKRDEAASIGTEIHGLADLVVRGEPTPPMGDVVRDRVLKYADWWKASGWKLRLSEAMVVSPALGYGGTFDLLAYDADGKTVLADVKTGKGVYKEVALQLTAYGMASFVDAGGKVFPMVVPDRYVVLHVTAAGVREIEINVGQMEQTAWLACIELSRWADTMKGKKF